MGNFVPGVSALRCCRPVCLHLQDLGSGLLCPRSADTCPHTLPVSLRGGGHSSASLWPQASCLAMQHRRLWEAQCSADPKAGPRTSRTQNQPDTEPGSSETPHRGVETPPNGRFIDHYKMNSFLGCLCNTLDSANLCGCLVTSYCLWHFLD